MTKKEFLYDWLFHYNMYTGLWNAFHRDDVSEYWNNQPTKYGVFKDTTHKSLLIRLYSSKFK